MARSASSNSPSRPPNRFEQRRQRNRDALLEAAIAVFQKRGIRGAKIEEICDRADVSPRTFFNHFETRDHLYQAIAQQRATQFAALFDAAASDPRPIGDCLPELLGSIADYLDSLPLYRELVGEMLHTRAEGGSEVVRHRSLGRAAQRFVAARAARGEIAERVRPEALADLLLGALTTALANWSASERYALRRELRHAAAALLILFTPRPPTRGR